MTIERAVMVFAGLMILASVALALLHSGWWRALTAFVGANITQAARTGFCPLALLLRRLGLRPGPAFVGPPSRLPLSPHPLLGHLRKCWRRKEG